MKKLVAYITSGYPDKNFSIDLALELAQSGVDTLELGVPFSDPVADGEVIEHANLLALQNGTRFADVLDIAKAVAPSVDTLLMGYFNPFYQYGMEALAKTLQSLHVKGLIIPDLPFEEARAYDTLFERYDMANIGFVAPTDDKARIETIVKNMKKFIYLVAYAGITGAKQSEDLTRVIADIRGVTDTPLYVGFGVNEKTAKEKAKGVDGVIVGSAFVNVLLDEKLSATQKIARCKKIAEVIKNEINA